MFPRLLYVLLSSSCSSYGCWSQADAKGTLIQRLAFDKRRSRKGVVLGGAKKSCCLGERDFERQYMVTKAEADEVRSLAKKAKGKGG